MNDYDAMDLIKLKTQIFKLRYALLWIKVHCGDQNYQFAMQGNGPHAAGIIRECRECAERVLDEQSPITIIL